MWPPHSVKYALIFKKSAFLCEMLHWDILCWSKLNCNTWRWFFNPVMRQTRTYHRSSGTFERPSPLFSITPELMNREGVYQAARKGLRSPHYHLFRRCRGHLWTHTSLFWSSWWHSLFSCRINHLMWQLLHKKTRQRTLVLLWIIRLVLLSDQWWWYCLRIE